MTDSKKFNALGSKYHDEGLDEKAVEAYDRAINLDPKWSVPWYNKGLLYKYKHQWQESFSCNLRAYELNPKDEAVIWNLGIAATALRNWKAARKAWKAYGISVEESDEELRGNYGMVPVRLNPDDEAEVIWGERIDPARVIIENIPYPQTMFCWKDIVLHDGAPVGHRILNGKEVPVFNSLGLFQKSGMRTFIWNPKNDYHVQEVEKKLEEFGGYLEVWSNTVRIICKKCSEGISHAKHDKLGSKNSEIRIGVAASSDAIVENINKSILNDVEEKIQDWETEN